MGGLAGFVAHLAAGSGDEAALGVGEVARVGVLELLRHLGLERRRPYQMRHTAATLWLASGEAPEWIARQLGHTTTEMLFRVYSRYVPNLTRRDGSAFERLITQSIADTPLPVNPTQESRHV